MEGQMGAHAPVDAVGTTIADRPPHRTVRARLRIRLPPWMGRGEACMWIRMQNAGQGNPAVKNRFQSIPRQHSRLTATTESKSPEPTQTLAKNTKPIRVTGNGIGVVSDDNLLQPFTDGRHRLVHPIAQLGFNRSKLCDHPLLGRFAPDDEGSTVARRPAIMRETQEREGLRFPFATSFSVLSGEPPKLDQPCLFRM